jgi:hypothetical protein
MTSGHAAVRNDARHVFPMSFLSLVLLSLLMLLLPTIGSLLKYFLKVKPSKCASPPFLGFILLLLLRTSRHRPTLHRLLGMVLVCSVSIPVLDITFHCL